MTPGIWRTEQAEWLWLKWESGCPSILSILPSLIIHPDWEEEEEDAGEGITNDVEEEDDDDEGTREGNTIPSFEVKAYSVEGGREGWFCRWWWWLPNGEVPVRSVVTKRKEESMTNTPLNEEGYEETNSLVIYEWSQAALFLSVQHVSHTDHFVLSFIRADKSMIARCFDIRNDCQMFCRHKTRKQSLIRETKIQLGSNLLLVVQLLLLQKDSLLLLYFVFLRRK